MSSLPEILRYSDDSEPGYTRKKSGDSFVYFDSQNAPVKNKAALTRFAGLGLPPAYEDVWICADEFGHIQATGRDVAGRKQYRYHPKWREFRDRQKFSNLADFGAALPALRRKIARDLRAEDGGKDFVCAAVVRLIDKGALRVGHDRNAAYGAGTLRRRHVKFMPDGIKLDYKAKGGKRVRKTVRDKTLSRILQSIDDLPGRRIFQYIGADGEIYGLDSAQVNAYLGEDYTAKTFRTWHGSVAAFECAQQADGPLTIKAMSEAAAARLHNTPAICRSSYIHPKILGLTEDNIAGQVKDAPKRGLLKPERQMLRFLQS